MRYHVIDLSVLPHNLMRYYNYVIVFPLQYQKLYKICFQKKKYKQECYSYITYHKETSSAFYFKEELQY